MLKKFLSGVTLAMLLMTGIAVAQNEEPAANPAPAPAMSDLDEFMEEGEFNLRNPVVQSLTAVVGVSRKENPHFKISELLNEQSEARIFEIISYSICCRENKC